MAHFHLWGELSHHRVRHPRVVMDITHEDFQVVEQLQQAHLTMARGELSKLFVPGVPGLNARLEEHMRQWLTPKHP